MGLIRMGPPEELILQLKAECSLPHFIETGTYRGDTASWASRNFQQVFSIEFAQELHEHAREKYSAIQNIEFLHGDSRMELEKILSRIAGPAVFWLDAHWSGGETYGDSDQCPLVKELTAIKPAPPGSVILIDDARLFLSPPQPPHDAGQWPDIVSIIDILRSMGEERYIVIIEDVIVAVPLRLKDTVVSYCRKVNAAAWEAYAKDKNTPGLQKGLALVGQDLVKRLKAQISILRCTIVGAVGRIRTAL